MTFSEIKDITSTFELLEKTSEEEKTLVLKTITLSAILGEQGLNSANFLNFEDQAALVFASLELAKHGTAEEILSAMIDFGINTINAQSRSDKLPAMKEKYKQASIDLDAYFAAYINILTELKELLVEAMEEI